MTKQDHIDCIAESINAFVVDKMFAWNDYFQRSPLDPDRGNSRAEVDDMYMYPTVDGKLRSGHYHCLVCTLVLGKDYLHSRTLCTDCPLSRECSKVINASIVGIRLTEAFKQSDMEVATTNIRSWIGKLFGEESK